MSLTFVDVLMSSVQDPEECLQNVEGCWYLMESEGLSCQDGYHNLSLTFVDVLMSSVQDPEECLRTVEGCWYLMESEGLSCQDG